MPNINAVFLSVLFGATGICAAANAQPIQWEASAGGNGHYYEFVQVAVTWDEAKALAEGRSFMGSAGHLATITSAEENDFIFNNLNFTGAGFPFSFPWIGGFQAEGSEEPAGGWTWVTGEPFVFTDWDTFEPNNSFGTEDVLQIIEIGGWNDNTRTNVFSFIVEYPVLDPIEAINVLIEAVLAIDIETGVSNALDSKLSNAIKILEKPRTGAPYTAVNILEAFINQVEAQTGVSITTGQAEQLVTQAQTIIDLLWTGS